MNGFPCLTPHLPLVAQTLGIDFGPVAGFIGTLTYGALVLVALWGAYCCIVLWRRIAELRFANEDEQDAFLDEAQTILAKNNAEDSLDDLCDGDPRGVSMLLLLALKNKNLPPQRLRAYLIERFQRDVLADLDYRMTWVQTIIKAAPMLGLFGTVVGMMGAFGKLSAASEVSADKLAGDIMFALITTAIGMSIAIPLILASAGISVRIGKLEDLVGSGLARILEMFERK